MPCVHSPFYQLLPLAALLSWVRRADSVTGGSKFDDVLKEYATVMREVYNSELVALLEHIKAVVSLGSG